jgi:hypothetical protein
MTKNEACTALQQVIDGATKSGLFPRASDVIFAQQALDLLWLEATKPEKEEEPNGSGL